MPTFIVKPKPDVDLYVGWSTVVDNLVWVANRAGSGEDPARLDRADQSGTSAMGEVVGWFDWTDAKFIVTNTQRRDAGFFFLRREDLLVYAQAYAANDTGAAEALLTPIPHEEDE